MKREVIELPAKDPADIQTRRKQLRVAAYCRVSTSLEAQQNSYEAQKEYYTTIHLRNYSCNAPNKKIGKHMNLNSESW